MNRELMDAVLMAIRTHNDWAVDGRRARSASAGLKIYLDPFPFGCFEVDGLLVPTWFWERRRIFNELQRAMSRQLIAKIAERSEERIQKVLSDFRPKSSAELERR